MRLLISAEQNRTGTTGGSRGQGEGSTTRHVIKPQLYAEEHDKWAACQLWNTRPEHRQCVNKHSTADSRATCTLLFPSHMLSFLCLAVVPPHSLLKHFPSALRGSLFSWNHFSPITVEQGGSKQLCGSLLFNWYAVCVSTLCSHH